MSLDSFNPRRPGESRDPLCHLNEHPTLPRYIRIEIEPMRIVLFDELDFPSSLPAFDSLLPLHRRFQCIVTLEPD
jgi:hypothetical protein